MSNSGAQPESPRRLRRWFQYSLRTLLLFVLLVSIGMSWFAVKMQQAKKQREAVEVIRRAGGMVIYDYHYGGLPKPPNYIDMSGKQASGPAWLRRVLGDDFFNKATVVFLARAQNPQECLDRLKDLPHLQKLDLINNQITDAELEHLEGMTELQNLILGDQITDAGLKRIVGLKRLEEFGFTSKRITDAGLECLERLKQLRTLYLNRTQTGDAGLKHLAGLSHLDHLFLDGTQVTDAGLEYLGGLSELKQLSLYDTRITDAGLEHLRTLEQLDALSLSGSKVTDKGVKKLQQALPNCKITR